MGKDGIEPVVVRQSFSHARTQPLVVETLKQRIAAATEGKAALDCPSCGSRMKLVRNMSTDPARLTASCPKCSGAST